MANVDLPISFQHRFQLKTLRPGMDAANNLLGWAYRGLGFRVEGSTTSIGFFIVFFFFKGCLTMRLFDILE